MEQFVSCMRLDIEIIKQKQSCIISLAQYISGHFSLHKNLIEHLNAEIVLHTISDISVAVEWLKYTFLYIRVFKNPKHYGECLVKIKVLNAVLVIICVYASHIY